MSESQLQKCLDQLFGNTDDSCGSIQTSISHDLLKLSLIMMLLTVATDAVNPLKMVGRLYED